MTSTLFTPIKFINRYCSSSNNAINFRFCVHIYVHMLKRIFPLPCRMDLKIEVIIKEVLQNIFQVENDDYYPWDSPLTKEIYSICFSRPQRIEFNWVKKKKRSNQIRPSKRNNRGGEQENQQQGQEMQCRRQDELQQPNQGLRTPSPLQPRRPNDIEAIETLWYLCT